MLISFDRILDLLFKKSDNGKYLLKPSLLFEFFLILDETLEIIVYPGPQCLFYRKTKQKKNMAHVQISNTVTKVSGLE